MQCTPSGQRPSFSWYVFNYRSLRLLCQPSTWCPAASDRCWPLYLCQVLYSFATQRFSRAKLFNIVIFIFMLWFALFGALYPSHETVHFHGLAETVLLRLPAGLAGLVGMVRHLRVPALFVTQGYISVVLYHEM